MSSSVSGSMAVPGRNTASVCLTESYPISTEADPSNQLRPEHTWGEGPAPQSTRQGRPASEERSEARSGSHCSHMKYFPCWINVFNLVLLFCPGVSDLTGRGGGLAD